VPFGEFGEPLGRVIATNVLAKLRDSAWDIAEGRAAPRWLFLVGGPGNGKSQMVEEFIRALGTALSCEDKLVEAVASEFRSRPTPRKVEIGGTSARKLLGEAFATRVSRLLIIQDASASDRADMDAAAQLDEDLINLLTEPRPVSEPIPILICCINRGLLARTIMAEDAGPPVVDLLESITRATGLGQEALSPKRPSCWPVIAPKFNSAFPEMAGLVACWPMDVESLMFSTDEHEPPAAIIIGEASSELRWEGAACADCDSREICPFFQNARWLREPQQGAALLRVLRRQELATGERWNFRAMFSLVAEVMVGEWEDFTIGDNPADHPCAWVHALGARAADQDPATSVPASFELMQHLYPQALFVGVLPSPGQEVVGFADSLPITGPVVRSVDSRSVRLEKAIRRRLESSFVPVMDPARWSPDDDTDVLYGLEDAYSQSVALGNDAWPASAPKAQVESQFLSWLVKAEDECDMRAGELPAKSLMAERFIRLIAAITAKRSVAIRSGRHADEENLSEYENTIRDSGRLAELQVRLRDLLSGRNFRADALSTFGQPENADDSLVLLVSNPVRVLPILPAPNASREAPAHDLPAIPVARRAIPLTYDLFVALQLRERGCSSGSLPASVRASLDRLKQLYAGEACRNEDQFLAGETYFEIDGLGRVTVTSAGGAPRFVGTDAR